jgi:hypothetical protein
MAIFLKKQKKNIENFLKDNKVSENNNLSPYSCFYTHRAYSLLQENLTRECIENNITEISETKKILNQLVKKHNYNSINTISQEPLYLRIKNGSKL